MQVTLDAPCPGIAAGVRVLKVDEISYEQHLLPPAVRRTVKPLAFLDAPERSVGEVHAARPAYEQEDVVKWCEAEVLAPVDMQDVANTQETLILFFQ